MILLVSFFFDGRVGDVLSISENRFLLFPAQWKSVFLQQWCLVNALDRFVSGVTISFFYASIPLQWQVLKHTTGKKGEVTGGLSSHVIENISDLVFVQVILMALLIFLVMVSLLWWNILGLFLFFFLAKIWFQGIFNIKVLVKISEGKLIGNVWNSSGEYMLEEVPIFTCDYGSK